MKKFILAVLAFFTMVPMFGQTADTTMVNLDEIVVASFYSSSLSVANVLDTDELLENNYGQEPSNYFAKMPSIISLNDNGTEFGYGYFRIRGLDQTRINVTLMYANAYVEDNNIDLTEEDYKTLEQLTWNIKRGIQWDRIFLLPPKNKFVDDGCRYMAQSSMEERMKNYDRLVELLKQFGWWDKVVILNGTFLENFNKVKDYINTKMSPDE